MWWDLQNIGMQWRHADWPARSPQHFQQPQITPQVVAVKVLKVMTTSKINPMDLYLSPPK